jgi:hypothetical protein
MPEVGFCQILAGMERKKWKEKGSVKSEKRVHIYSSFTVMLTKRM